MSRGRQKTFKARKAAKTMADYVMSFERLGSWLDARSMSAKHPRPQTTSLSMLDGAIAAIVAGPVSMPPEEWVCTMLGVDADAFNHDTEEFSAIAATLTRHNAISDTLSTNPEGFEPFHARTPVSEVDARPWRMGFYAVMQLRLLDWSQLLASSAPEDSPLRPILFYCADEAGKPVLYAALQDAVATSAHKAWRDIPANVEIIRQFWMPIRSKRR
jgi:uncharacterized protein